MELNDKEQKRLPKTTPQPLTEETFKEMYMLRYQQHLGQITFLELLDRYEQILGIEPIKKGKVRYMSALERHKQKILDRYNEGIGIQPFWVLHNYVYEQWQKGITPTTGRAYQIMRSAELYGRPNPGRCDIELAFEVLYQKHPREAVRALKLILSCPTEIGYKEYVADKKAGSPKGYSALMANYGVPVDEGETLL